MLGNDVAGFAIEDVVEPGLGPLFASQALEVQERIGDPPAGVGVDMDEPLVPGRHFVRVAIPFQEALVEVVGLPDEGDLEVQPGCGDRITLRVSELRDDHLVRLADDVESSAGDRHAKQH